MKLREEGTGYSTTTTAVIVEPTDVLMLTTLEHDRKTCVYVRVVGDKLEIEGGDAIRRDVDDATAMSRHIASLNEADMKTRNNIMAGKDQRINDLEQLLNSYRSRVRRRDMKLPSGSPCLVDDGALDEAVKSWR